MKLSVREKINTKYFHSLHRHRYYLRVLIDQGNRTWMNGLCYGMGCRMISHVMVMWLSCNTGGSDGKSAGTHQGEMTKSANSMLESANDVSWQDEEWEVGQQKWCSLLWVCSTQLVGVVCLGIATPITQNDKTEDIATMCTWYDYTCVLSHDLQSSSCRGICLWWIRCSLHLYGFWYLCTVFPTIKVQELNLEGLANICIISVKLW